MVFGGKTIRISANSNTNTMWGGVVDSDSSPSSATAAWGTNVGGAPGADPTSPWMNSNPANQTGWSSAGGGQTASKSGWDAQQQPSLVSSTGAGGQSTGNSWQTASNAVQPVNGWTGSTGGGQTNWNTGSGQQVSG